MKKSLHVSALCILIFLVAAISQAINDIGGEIETRLNFDINKSKSIWSRTSLKLNVDSKFGDKVRSYANVKLYTTEELNFDWKLTEAYAEYYGKKLDIRGGLQIVSWGTAYSINPTDKINPFDLSEEEAFIPEEKLGVIALKMKFYPITNLSLTGIYLPYFVPALEIPEVALPEKNLNNSEYAIKISAQSPWGWDISACFFDGKEDYPWTNGQYRDVLIYGGDVIGTIWEIALWGEGAYTIPKIGNSYYDIAVGGEYTFRDDLYFMGQFYHRNNENNKENYLMSVLRYAFSFPVIESFQIGVAYEFDNEFVIVYPELSFSFGDAISLVLSGIATKGDAEGTFMGQIKDKILVKLKYSF